jgi:hypothetical protein
MALTVDQSDLKQITLTASKLNDSNLRQQLSMNCATLPAVTGAAEVAKIFKELIDKPAKEEKVISETMFKLKLQDIFGRGWRETVYSALQLVMVAYRMVKPHNDLRIAKANDVKIFEGSDSQEIGKLIKSGNPFEHLLLGASQAYKNTRIEIASKAYLK